MTLCTLCVGLLLADCCAGSSIDSLLLFNTNDLPSDTTGTLQGTVLFAQHQIIPSKNTVANEDQPHLTAKREMLVMFKPMAGLAGDEAVSMNMKVTVDAEVRNVVMAPPSEIPRHVGWVDALPSSLNFPTFRTGSMINTVDEMPPLQDPNAVFLLSKLAASGNVTIETADGQWVRDIYLPSENATLHRNMITVQSTATYTSNIIRTALNGMSRTDVIATDESITFVNVNGAWFSDRDGIQNTYIYGHFWTARVAAELVAPGMVLTFTHGELQGVLSDVVIGGASELLLHTIDVGMLTPPRAAFTFQNDFHAHAEYFQTIPVARFTVTQYAPLHLSEVMLPTGVLLTDFDPSMGGWYDGDMRQYIGKLLISHGIDLANYGVWSSESSSEEPHTQTFYVAQFVAHNSIGKYANGVQVHGLSGGNGMVTLGESVGNEFSHEVGHNYGLGHYVGGAAGSIHRPANQPGSTWGWDSRNNLFVPNFRSTRTATEACCTSCPDPADCVAAWEGFQFGFDAMAAGSPNWSNRFTMYTPHASRNIQQFLENKAVFSEESRTGFKKMDQTTKQMVEWDHPLGAKPTAHGVPVTTIVGYYDPQRVLTSYIFPAMHGSFGYIYESDGNATASTGCELVVSTTHLGQQRFQLASSSFESGKMNKFHVNVATVDGPVSASVRCSGMVLAARALEAPPANYTLKTTVNGVVISASPQTPIPVSPKPMASAVPSLLKTMLPTTLLPGVLATPTKVPTPTPPPTSRLPTSTPLRVAAIPPAIRNTATPCVPHLLAIGIIAGCLVVTCFPLAV
jgi:hypothetical protein